MNPNGKRVLYIATTPLSGVRISLTPREIRLIKSGRLPNAYYNRDDRRYQLSPCDSCLIVNRFNQWVYDDLNTHLNNKLEAGEDQRDCCFHFNSVLKLVQNYFNSPEIRKYTETLDFNDFLETGVVHEN